MPALISSPAASFAGTITVPGDKSISHRALMLGGLTVGTTRVHGLLEGEDVLCTGEAMRAYGARVTRGDDGVWRIDGVGIGGLAEPEDVIDLGNSGTGARLLIGIAASHPVTSIFTGDASLRRRPMRRVTEPLRQIGAGFVGREGDRLPIAVTGAASPLPIEYRTPMASAQVKSAVLLAGLNTPGETAVIEATPTRDHSEHLLRHFGARVEVTEMPDGARRIALSGQPELTPAEVRVPGDPSSAAFPIVAALLTPGADVTIQNVGINPLRAGLLTTLQEMGGDIELTNRREQQFEPVADIRVKGSALSGIAVPTARAASMIDEYPVLAVAAAAAAGKTELRGLAELRVKESDRIAAMAAGLSALGVPLQELEDGLIIEGSGGRPPSGNQQVTVATEMDHRIAMSFLVYGMAARTAVSIDDAGMIDTSFPGFVGLMNRLGADIAAP